MTTALFSTRSVNSQHGTGVQLQLLREFAVTNSVLVNYGQREYGVEDGAVLVDSNWRHAWPFRHRGRRKWYQLIEALRLSSWRNDALTALGKTRLLQLIQRFNISEMHAVVDSERSARRMLEICRCVQLPYAIILYDWVHTETASVENFPNLTSVLADARSIFAISPALERLARTLNGSNIQPIGFYRSVPTNSANHQRESTPMWQVGVISQACHAAFKDLYQACCSLIQRQVVPHMFIHVIGNFVMELPSNHSAAPSVIFHGRTSAEQKDAILAQCDLGFVAGPMTSPAICPFAKYSIPSKMGDFTAVGLPVIARSAPSSALSEFLLERCTGFARVAHSAAEIEREMAFLIADERLCQARGRAARDWADNHVLLPRALRSLQLGSPAGL